MQTEFDKQLSSERFRVFDAKVLSEGRFAHAERIDYTQPASEGGGGGARPRHRSLRTGQILSDGRVILRIGVANYGTPHGRRHSLIIFDPKSATVENDPLSAITDAAELSSDMAGVDLLQKAMDALPGWERDFQKSLTERRSPRGASSAHTKPAAAAAGVRYRYARGTIRRGNELPTKSANSPFALVADAHVVMLPSVSFNRQRRARDN